MTYAYFNNGLSLRAVDPDYVAQTGEVLFPGIAESNELAAAFPGYTEALGAVNRAAANAPILAQIADLESKQARAVREIALGNTASASHLEAIDTQIIALRAQLA